MPATIDPLSFNPSGPFDFLLAYFYLTWMRVDYYNDWPEGRNAIYALMGVEPESVEVFEPRPGPGILTLIPLRSLVHLPGGQAVLLIRGSTSAVPEIASEVITSALSSRSPHPGQVSNYFGAIAAEIWEDVGPSVPAQWITAGHSLGGALAGLMVSFGASKVYTAGAPREGNLGYAQARNDGAKIRLTNAGDPVPHVPLSTTTFLDDLPLTLPVMSSFVLGYRHWGRRKHLWPDGTLTLPPTQDEPYPAAVAQGLRNLLLGGPLFDAHLPPSYCERLRRGIPVAFPASAPDVDFPGLQELDDLNLQMNQDDGLTWVIDGRGGILPSSGLALRLPDSPDVIEFPCG